MRKAIIVFVPLIAMLAIAQIASGAIRSATITIDPNPGGPQFEPGTQPLVAVAVSYDEAGTLTISESGAVTSPYTAHGGDETGVTWRDLGFVEISHCAETIGSEAPTLTIDWGAPERIYYIANPGEEGEGTPVLSAPTGKPTLKDSAVGGDLEASFVLSEDDSTLTATWSNPLLAGQNFTCVILENDRGTGQAPWTIFPGYESPKTPQRSERAATSPAVTAHYATPSQKTALGRAFRHYRRYGEYREGLGNLSIIRDIRTTNNGWAEAVLAARHPRRYEQKGNQIIFHKAGRWRVVSFGSAPGVDSGVPRKVLEALAR